MEITLITPKLGEGGRKLPPPRPRVDIPLSEQVLEKRAALTKPGSILIDYNSVVLDPAIYDQLLSFSISSTEVFDMVEVAIKSSVIVGRSSEPHRAVVAAAIKLEELVGKFKHIDHVNRVLESHKASLEIAAYAMAHSVLLNTWAKMMDSGNIDWKVAI